MDQFVDFHRLIEANARVKDGDAVDLRAAGEAANATPNAMTAQIPVVQARRRYDGLEWIVQQQDHGGLT